jgi:hypothetical protein
MNAAVIVQIVVLLLLLLLSLAPSLLGGDDLEQVLRDIIQKGLQTYQEQVGKPLDPSRVGLLNPL